MFSVLIPKLTTQIAVGESLLLFVFLRVEECWSYYHTLVSGSPILQDGKLVGAITHVFVDDPTRGYAVFAENMLETAQSMVNGQRKEAG